MDFSSHQQEYMIQDLPTRSVTLFPGRAQVVRDVKQVSLKPGLNQITVVGLTPTVDEDSIKVEGLGSAIITDISVELLPNRRIFQEVYPDSDPENSDSDSGCDSDSVSDDQNDDAHPESQELKDLQDKLIALRDDQQRAKELVASAEARLRFLDAWVLSLDEQIDIQVSDRVETYRRERALVFQDHMEGSTRARELSHKISSLVKLQDKLLRSQLKRQAKAQKAQAKEKAKAARREAQRLRDKTRIQKERERFWPRSCYTIHITLDATSFTPAASRRPSIGSLTDVFPADSGPTDSISQATGAAGVCDLSLSYVTTSAFWSPSYDLQVSTTAGTAILFFDAQLTNMTSESWNNCKIILSTSHTDFSGLKDVIPTLTPWRITLGKLEKADSFNLLTQPIAVSSKEEEMFRKARELQVQSRKPRSQLFGISQFFGNTAQGENIFGATKPGARFPAPHGSSGVFGQQANCPNTGGGLFGQNNQATASSSLFGSTKNTDAVPAVSGIFGQNTQTTTAGSLFGSVKNTDTIPSGGGGLFGSAAPAQTANLNTEGNLSDGTTRLFPQHPEQEKGEEDTHSELFDTHGHCGHEDDAESSLEPQPELSFQESAMEETGLTTTYELPGQKSLVPSSTLSKQRVAHISFTNVTFGHTVIAKYKPAAFLKATLRNSSKMTLLKGSTGLTLDGSFIGRSTLPRCSPGDSFDMNFGVDPAIKVIYQRPQSSRSRNTIFSNNVSHSFCRSVTVANTRASASKPVNLTVLDQVPTSEDDRLRVCIVHPQGLTVGGLGVDTGLSSREDQGRNGKDDKYWGKATATVKKNGEVSWKVSLNPGKSVKLDMEYDVLIPVGAYAVQV